jgi:hypothetical protein
MGKDVAMVYLMNYLISTFAWKTADNYRRNFFRKRNLQGENQT